MTGPPRVSRVLVVTAVPAERDAVLRALGPPDRTGSPDRTGAPVFEVLAAGVGPAAAAAATAGELTAAALRGEPYGLVVSAGIGGGFAPAAPPGAAVVASRIIAADLGAGSPDGFLDVAELGFGRAAHQPPERLARAVADASGAVHAPVLTVSTVTGTAERAAELAARHPGAAAEAMEGFGVAEAAARGGLPVLEIRTVSNAVGPRDRAAWRIPEALRALTGTCGRIRPVLDSWSADHDAEHA
ncbi:futalosine hydrolase [Streptomyces sp. ACA25]|uniref:futalosine hydrolase n=1 Tax=Streptomyces sp. ACA25 TaxID=3022596 RepID=UPI0023075298|nr:futalosine hydrolase [Streptomyces sp. ACA25]MDB1088132.1 futalosine hydrolase [Streptomyces sp. ACA25]